MEDPTSMPENGGQQANVRIERNSSGKAIHQQISSSATVDSPSLLLIRIEKLDETNGIHQGVAPNTPSTSNSQITPASNNSAGTSNGQSSRPNEDPQIHQGATPNIPSEDPKRDKPLDDYLPLLRAALKDDWPAAKAFYDNDNECVRASITKNKATALHIAVSAHHTDFIKKWLPLMKQEDLVLPTNSGFTALHFAAQVGNVSIAEQLVKNNNALPSFTNSEGDTPLIVAAYVGHTNMVSYLFSLSSPLERLGDEKRIELLKHTIRNDMYDIALKILKTDTNIANADTECRWEALEMLAMKLAFSIGSESRLSFWKSLLNSCAGMHSLASYDTEDNKENMLHLAGKLAPADRLNIVSGAALQMQRELLWFKEIEKIVPQKYLKSKNRDDKTPKEIFEETHKDLKKDGEKWMKDTANYCMLVATLIATVIFAAAFTVPGGSNQVTGIPLLFGKKGLMVFFISDAIALCSSSTSIVIFLSILTSRYTEDDFLKSLPSKLLFGLATLFISMAFMMVAFIATFFLVCTRRGWAWTAGVVITSASIPILSFGWLHCKIWVDTFRSTYKSRFLFRPHKHRLF